MSSLALPLDPTPAVAHTVRGRGPPSGRSYNFLQGEPAAPSSSEFYHHPLEKKGFKPGWNSKRHQGAIKQDQERLGYEAAKAERQERSQARAREVALDRHLTHGFNPMTGQEYSKSEASWKPASDPWAHQRVGIRPRATIEAQTVGATAHRASAQDRQQALAPVVDMRRERIANGGLSAHQRRHGGVAALLNWGS